jgi:methyl-accepting chemotaxis protein
MQVPLDDDSNDYRSLYEKIAELKVMIDDNDNDNKEFTIELQNIIAQINDNIGEIFNLIGQIEKTNGDLNDKTKQLAIEKADKTKLISKITDLSSRLDEQIKRLGQMKSSRVFNNIKDDLNKLLQRVKDNKKKNQDFVGISPEDIKLNQRNRNESTETFGGIRRRRSRRRHSGGYVHSKTSRKGKTSKRSSR